MVIRHQQIINCWLTVSGIHMDETRLISNRKSDGLFYLSCAYITDNLHVELKFTDDSIILSKAVKLQLPLRFGFTNNPPASFQAV